MTTEQTDHTFELQIGDFESKHIWDFLLQPESKGNFKLAPGLGVDSNVVRAKDEGELVRVRAFLESVHPNRDEILIRERSHMTDLYPNNNDAQLARMLSGDETFEDALSFGNTTTRLRYDPVSDSLKHILTARGIDYSDGLTDVSGISFTDRDTFIETSEAGFNYAMKSVLKSTRTGLGIHVVAFRQGDTSFYSTSVLKNNFNLPPTHQSYYQVDIPSIPPAYRIPDLSKSCGLALNGLIHNIIVDSLN